METGQSEISQCSSTKSTANFEPQQMIYKCRLLYAHGLSREVNGVIDQLARELRGFLGRCDSKMQGKIRGLILQFFNPAISSSAQINCQNEGKGEEKIAVGNGSTGPKQLNNPNGKCDYQRHLALLNSQIQGIQQQVPVISHQLQRFGRKLALTESALRGQQRQLSFRKVVLSDVASASLPSLAALSMHMQTAMSHDLAMSGIPSPLGIPSHIFFNGGSPSKNRAKKAYKLATQPNFALKQAPAALPLPIFPSGVLTTSTPTTPMDGVPSRTLATISHRSNIPLSIWSQCVPGLPKLVPRGPGMALTFSSAPQLQGDSFVSLSPVTKHLGKSTSPSRTSRTRVIKEISHLFPMPVKLSPKNGSNLHSDTVKPGAAVTDMVKNGPRKRARSDEHLHAHVRPRVKLINGYHTKNYYHNKRH